MAVDVKYEYNAKMLLRDTRPVWTRFKESAAQPIVAAVFYGVCTILVAVQPSFTVVADLILAIGLYYLVWLLTRHADVEYSKPKSEKGGDGIMFIGNQRKNKSELWISNNDARTHILYLGTTGSGKTEGLKSLVSNALCWGSGFVYVDGKADTDLWASIYAMARRFGRDDDIMVLNYMTGNSDMATVSNTMNPFSNGSASYLTNMMVGLMDEAGGDTAMWKGRAVSLMGALMPALTWKRDHEGLLLDVQVIRDALNMPDIIRMSREKAIPDRIKKGIKGYLTTLPGYSDDGFDDDGNERPPGPGNPGADMTVPRQQHGYLTMQFTRSLQSLADEYGHIFRTQLADIDMMDIVLNRRMMLVLIPALEKSGDEAANLGKIVAANLKGMMGATLGADVEGDWEKVIENKVTRSSSPFVTVFDEVGYYAAQGMAVMAAQARSLGFSLIFAAQDLPALEKRVKEEARSIAANCNMKIFGKLEDPTQTREFFENTVGMATISKAGNFEINQNSLFGNYREQKSAAIGDVKKATYGELRSQKEGQAHINFKSDTIEVNMFYANPKKVKAMRINRFLRVNPNAVDTILRDSAVDGLLKNFRNPAWTVARAVDNTASVEEFDALNSGFMRGWEIDNDFAKASALAVAEVAQQMGLLKKSGRDDDDDEDDDLSLDNLLGGEVKRDSKKPPPLLSLEKDDDDDDVFSPKFLFGDDKNDAPASLEDLAAPNQQMTQFMADIMARTGKQLGQTLFARDKAA